MNLSKIQTIDFILKQYANNNPYFKNQNLKILLKCDNDYIYGDVVEVKSDYLVEKFLTIDNAFNGNLLIKYRYINIENSSTVANQIEEFSSRLANSISENCKILNKIFENSDSISMLQKYILLITQELKEENDLSTILYNPHFLNNKSCSAIPFLDLNIYKNVEFVSIIPTEEN